MIYNLPEGNDRDWEGKLSVLSLTANDLESQIKRVVYTLGKKN